MKFFIGDNLRLAGKTRHGKNRIHENGDMWEVTNLDGQGSSISVATISMCSSSGMSIHLQFSLRSKSIGTTQILVDRTEES